MGAVPSTQQNAAPSTTTATEYLTETFVGEKSVPIASDYWQKLLRLPPLSIRSSTGRLRHAFRLLAQNNPYTWHLAKILIHLSWYLQEATSNSGASPAVYMKAVNAAYISSVLLKYLIENSETEYLKELCLSLDVNEPVPEGFVRDQNVLNLIVHSILTFIGSVEVSPDTYLLHQELLDFMLVGMATQLRSGPSPRPKEVHPFIDAAMAQLFADSCSVISSDLVLRVMHITTCFLREASRVSFGELVLPQQPLCYCHSIIPSNQEGEGSKSLLADYSLHVLLVLIHYHKFYESDGPLTDRSDDNATSESPSKVNSYFTSRALHSAMDIEFDRMDVEGNAHSGPLVRLPFASLFDTLCMCLADESAVLLFYSLIHGNSDFLEYVLVRTDLDTLLMPMLETLYNASKKTSNQIYMLLIVLLILSQDSSFNTSIHKLIRRCMLATLANMAPHVHHLSAYASQRLVSLFFVLLNKYNKLAEDKTRMAKINSIEPDSFAKNMSAELQTYTDFLTIVLEILNAILTYALPRNPEVVYAILHKQDVFQPFKNHPRYSELIGNICNVLDYFNSRLDAQNVAGEWSAEKVLQFITSSCRSWHGEGMKMFTQLHFSYEQESHHEEFFIPGMSFNPGAINLFPVSLPVEKQIDHQEVDFNEHQNGEMKGLVAERLPV